MDRIVSVCPQTLMRYLILFSERRSVIRLFRAGEMALRSPLCGAFTTAAKDFS